MPSVVLGWKTETAYFCLYHKMVFFFCWLWVIVLLGIAGYGSICGLLEVIVHPSGTSGFQSHYWEVDCYSTGPDFICNLPSCSWQTWFCFGWRIFFLEFVEMFSGLLTWVFSLLPLYFLFIDFVFPWYPKLPGCFVPAFGFFACLFLEWTFSMTYPFYLLCIQELKSLFYVV